ncbi:helix-turn-helix domain-containing protein [Sphingobacterium hungaricum]|uniref:AraC family transcriptional regulator n=1 Tax=Sphingobacterium hungaricum TaxID=2082723 RepID=A0A928V0V8_9SPHI|nr:AraC family transcriptional regulator [Sphingobacterium hungaricum]MBE8714921.1 AraC family transcriptional regulator [Sphingobacterium hungaricum]
MDLLFSIRKVDRAEAIKVNNSPNKPHVHNYEELIIGIKGQLRHFIDFKAKIYTSPFISFVSKGKIHQVDPILVDDDCDFWVIRFKSEFIPETTFQLYQYYHDQASLMFTSKNRFERINTLAKLIQDEMAEEDSELAIVRQLLVTIFINIEAERKLQESDSNELLCNQNITFKNFLAILEENFRRPEGVAFYAEKLFMSARNLNKITQSILNQSVSELIETRKLIEAKNLLLTSDKTISEIGFDLGYSDKAYFTHVFKKKAGQTPSEFRNEIRGETSK